MRPNIILLMTDQQTDEMITFVKASRPRKPNENRCRPALPDGLEERLESANDIARWLPGNKVGVGPAVPSPSEETTVYRTKTA